ncbi:hypothetical protein Pint_18911 [Pistacia integerrima]|uniref:Uncharacterized protein n=1 Tax=Pistacia integerrima TaxID=434235 RepID=A0ACC0YX70_9ROSI|nr:hypothetical protein Pint_18911 [Pistacia integerrima]
MQGKAVKLQRSLWKDLTTELIIRHLFVVICTTTCMFTKQKTETLNAEPAAVLLSNSKPIQSQDSKTLRTKASLKGSPRSDNEVSQELDDTDDQTVDTQRLLVATKEIVNLMNKDYRGMPRRKPPINNDEPRH